MAQSDDVLYVKSEDRLEIKIFEMMGVKLSSEQN